MAPPPALTDPEELVEEVLRRLPPDDPASIFRAALVSKRWHRLISGRGFRRRFREFHRSPPLLGFLCNRADEARLRFVPASSFRPRDADRRGLRAVHSGHGRVLLRRERWGRQDLLVVWDPTTDEQRELPLGPLCWYLSTQRWSAAVLCAAAAANGGAGGGCNHLDCRHGPFLVVVVASPYSETFSCVYSSETDLWSDSIYALGYHDHFELGNTVLLGSALYFKSTTRILKYDLLTQETSSISLPWRAQGQPTVLMATEDGKLGFATARGYRLYLWSREHGPDDGARWAQDKIIDLDTILPVDAFSTGGPQVAGFSENGAGSVIFLWTDAGFFLIDLKSQKSKKVGESHGYNSTVVPYLSFLTPALQAAPVPVEPSA